MVELERGHKIGLFWMLRFERLTEGDRFQSGGWEVDFGIGNSEYAKWMVSIVFAISSCLAWFVSKGYWKATGVFRALILSKNTHRNLIESGVTKRRLYVIIRRLFKQLEKQCRKLLTIAC